MRKLLLTSSQVSILLYSTIVISCTLALFLSGYVIQQRTLRDLRAAVRPRQSRPSPKVYLPDHFKTPAVEIEQAPAAVSDADSEHQFHKQEQPPVIEIAQTPPELPVDHGDVSREKLAMLESIKVQAEKQSWGVENPDPDAKNRLPVTRAERRRLIKQEIQRLSQSDERVLYQRRLW
ncbi:hypothetical protein S7711_09707 [Stachybotrys chartarum IBT 7711]|uniref:Uncharacterized protein n=1 Tax=Stachybotrys chartarum (strain CBS 109288 / IBT 7711) TaxID=1280523 RepID=A0A084AM26_STACB|nr:hypothetical protein S7711_09707 [Stachybotrys chartarum IBT 7711]